MNNGSNIIFAQTLYSGSNFLTFNHVKNLIKKQKLTVIFEDTTMERRQRDDGENLEVDEDDGHEQKEDEVKVKEREMTKTGFY